MASATISQLFIHPVKGCRGISVQSATLTKTGLEYDREWAVVRASDGKFVSMREEPKLALVVPELVGNTMTITAPNMNKPLIVPLVPTSTQTRTCTVWEWTGTALDEGDEAAAWFTSYLGSPNRLVRYIGSEGGAKAADAVRPTDPEFAPGSETALSDGFPMLLANEASLADLNARLAASDSDEANIPIMIRAFRPNIVVSGLPAWEEDKWRQLRVTPSAGGGHTIEMTSVKPCSRCKVPTINPETGVPSQGEPSDILAMFRKGSHLQWSVKSWKHAVHFGWNLIHSPQAVGQVVSVGDRVEFSVPQTAW